MGAIREGGGAGRHPGGRDSSATLWEAVDATARNHGHAPTDGQPVTVAVRVEATGMVTQGVNVAAPYGASVHSLRRLRLRHREARLGPAEGDRPARRAHAARPPGRGDDPDRLVAEVSAAMESYAGLGAMAAAHQLGRREKAEVLRPLAALRD